VYLSQLDVEGFRSLSRVSITLGLLGWVKTCPAAVPERSRNVGASPYGRLDFLPLSFARDVHIVDP
jgi:hypothetical protein